MTSAFHPARWTLVLQASRPDRQTFRRRQRALPAVEAQKLIGIQHDGGSDLQDVVGAIADGGRVFPGKLARDSEDRWKIQRQQLNSPGRNILFVQLNDSARFLRGEFSAELPKPDGVHKFKRAHALHMQRAAPLLNAANGSLRVGIGSVERKQKTGAAQSVMRTGQYSPL